MNIRDQVQEFHSKFGVPMPDSPAWPPPERLMLRVKLIAEEFCELLYACGAQPDKLGYILGSIDRMLREGLFPIEGDLPEVADALADLDYVIEGTRLEFGIDGRPIAELVHASNMAKEGGATRADGKILKPQGWQAPDIAGELRRQGWAG